MSPIPDLDVDSTPARYLSNLVNGFWATQVINTAVILGVPDQLASGPRTAESLAASMAALWKQFGDLAHCVKTGETIWAHASGEEGFKQLASDPVRLAAFQGAMAESSIRATQEAEFSVLEAVP
jgi:hypothetical protein